MAPGKRERPVIARSAPSRLRSVQNRRETNVKPLYLSCLILALPACGHYPAAAPTSPVTATQGKAFAESTCASCHATGPHGRSPNPDAPPFADIVNQEGLTAATLAAFLRDAHNYPQEMQFALEPGDVDRLVAFMLQLKDPNYRPPI